MKPRSRDLSTVGLLHESFPGGSSFGRELPDEAEKHSDSDGDANTRRHQNELFNAILFLRHLGLDWGLFCGHKGRLRYTWKFSECE